MTKELDHMIQKFPGYRGRLIELFRTNEDFRSLCDDYWQCDSKLIHLRQNTIKDTRAENSYALLFLDLEQEVMRFLTV